MSETALYLKQMELGPMQNFVYLIGDPGTRECVVVDPAFSWGHDAPLRIPWHKTLIYEMHVKGFTARHPKVPEELRGTYAGLTHPAVIDYLKSLGITAVELMPVHQFVADKSKKFRVRRDRRIKKSTGAERQNIRIERQFDWSKRVSCSWRNAAAFAERQRPSVYGYADKSIRTGYEGGATAAVDPCVATTRAKGCPAAGAGTNYRRRAVCITDSEVGCRT